MESDGVPPKEILAVLPRGLGSTPSVGRNCFVRVQYSTWIEQLFHLAHEFEGRSSPTVVDVFALAESDAMFGADATSTPRHVLVEERLDETDNFATVLWTCRIEVKVA